MERKITPAASSSLRKVVATETLSNTASTATLRLPSTPASTFCSSIGMPSFFAYLGWSLLVLAPIYVILTLLFFL